MRWQDFEAGGLDDRAKAGEGGCRSLFGEAEHGDFAACAAAEGFDHRLALSHAEVVPIGADERQAIALRDVGIDADDRDAGIDRAVDDPRIRAGFQPTIIMPAGLRAAVSSIWGGEGAHVVAVGTGDRGLHAQLLLDNPEGRVIVGFEQRQIHVATEPDIFLVR